MNGSTDFPSIAVAIAVALLAVGFAVMRRVTGSGAGEMTARRSSIRQRAPAVRTMLAGLLAAGVGLFAMVMERGEDAGAARGTGAVADAAAAAADSGAAVVGDGSGPWLAVAIAIGVLALALGVITLIRSQNTRS